MEVFSFIPISKCKEHKEGSFFYLVHTIWQQVGYFSACMLQNIVQSSKCSIMSGYIYIIMINIIVIVVMSFIVC